MKYMREGWGSGCVRVGDQGMWGMGIRVCKGWESGWVRIGGSVCLRIEDPSV